MHSHMHKLSAFHGQASYSFFPELPFTTALKKLHHAHKGKCILTMSTEQLKAASHPFIANISLKTRIWSIFPH